MVIAKLEVDLSIIGAPGKRRCVRIVSNNLSKK
jgi:hypothetical protein